MKIWDRTHGTIREFADAIAKAEPDNLPADEIYHELLRAIWLGKFEAAGENGDCATSLPNVDGSWQAGREGLGGGTVWEDAEGRPQPRPYPPFGPEHLRSALFGDDPRAKRRKPLPSFEALADWPVEMLIARSVLHARATYLDGLLVETRAIQRWRTENTNAGLSMVEPTNVPRGRNPLSKVKSAPITHSGAPGRPSATDLIVALGRELEKAGDFQSPMKKIALAALLIEEIKKRSPDLGHIPKPKGLMATLAFKELWTSVSAAWPNRRRIFRRK